MAKKRQKLTKKDEKIHKRDNAKKKPREKNATKKLNQH